MKVLLCIRGDYLRNFGGDSMQVLKTAEYLRKIGVIVDVNNGHISDFSEYDIIHLFNLVQVGETYKYYRLAKRYKKIIAISPIYWDLNNYYEKIGDTESLKLWKRCNIYRREILKGCKMVYINSRAEFDNIKTLSRDNLKYTLVHNGVDRVYEDTPLYSLRNRYNLDNYVLCVGRICKRKNQLMLSKVCDKLNIQLIIVGAIEDKEYFNQCIAYKNVRYLGFIDGYDIYNAYKFAKVHASVGFGETPGLTSLEAAACGCNIVSTIESCTKEYFEDNAIYCDPYDEESIYEAVSKAYREPKNYELKKIIVEKYKWSTNIQLLYENYKTLLG